MRTVPFHLFGASRPERTLSNEVFPDPTKRNNYQKLIECEYAFKNKTSKFGDLVKEMNLFEFWKITHRLDQQ